MFMVISRCALALDIGARRNQDALTGIKWHPPKAAQLVRIGRRRAGPPGQHLPRNWPIGTARKYRKLLEEKN
jgi:hypothetical protein